MTHDDVIRQARDLIAAHLHVSVDDITPDASFVEDLGADSLDLVELVMDVERTFSIKIPDEDAVTLRTVQDAIDYVRPRMSKS